MDSSRHSSEASEQASGPAGIAALIPHGLFIMTAAYEDASAATLVRWVQRCSQDPIVVMVSLRRGQAIEPLIRDSRSFALCQISDDDRYLQRKFSGVASGTINEDELLSMSTRAAPSGSPILEHAMSYMDCQLLRNVDLETEYRLYVGQVLDAQLLSPKRPALFFGQCNGRQ